MRYDQLRRYLPIVIAAIVLQSGNASAFYDATKLNDWKYHSYICKAVVMALSVILTVEQKNGRAATQQHENDLKTVIKDTVISQEKGYKFDDFDGEFIADIVFAARAGFDAGNIPFSIPNIQNQGFDICVSILDEYDNDLRKAKQ